VRKRIETEQLVVHDAISCNWAKSKYLTWQLPHYDKGVKPEKYSPGFPCLVYHSRTINPSWWIMLKAWIAGTGTSQCAHYLKFPWVSSIGLLLQKMSFRGCPPEFNYVPNLHSTPSLSGFSSPWVSMVKLASLLLLLIENYPGPDWVLADSVSHWVISDWLSY